MHRTMVIMKTKARKTMNNIVAHNRICRAVAEYNKSEEKK